MLLETKLYTPQLRPHLVPRPHLLDKINVNLQHSHLVLVSAPAGFGKTTLVTTWLNAQKRYRTAWLALDQNDNEPRRFFTYVSTALQRADDAIGQTALALLAAPQPPAFDMLTTTLINDLVASDAEIVMVLDDYHLIQTAAIHEAIVFMLENAPPAFHLVLTTRLDPPLPLSRLRSRGQMLEIRVEDLRFSREEAMTLLNENMALALSTQQIEELMHRTEGWVTALQLATTSMQKRTDWERFIASFTGSHRYVLDYLTDEVLRHLPAATTEFLLQSVVLERMCGSLCDAVTKRCDSQAMLEALDAANLFIVPLDDERRWYRYHHLFADLLRHRLNKNRPELLPQLHLRASHWFAEQRAYADAIHHAHLAGDYSRMADLIEQHAHDMGWAPVLFDWFAALPDEILDRRPHLLRVYATLSFMFRHHENFDALLSRTQNALQEALHRGEISKQEQSEMFTELLGLRAGFLNYFDRWAEAAHLIEQALPSLPTEPTAARYHLFNELARAYVKQGESEAGQAYFEQALQISESLDDPSLQLMCLANLMSVVQTLGRLEDVLGLGERGLTLSRAHGDQLHGFDWHIHLELGIAYYQLNELDHAATHFTTIVERFPLITDGALSQPFSLISLLYLAQIDLAQGHQHSVEQRLGRASDVAAQLHLFTQQLRFPHVWDLALALLAHLHLKLGRLAEAQQWAQARNWWSVTDLEAMLADVHPIHTELCVLAHLYLAMQDPLAQSLTRYLVAKYQYSVQKTTQIEIYLVAAMVERQMGTQEQAHAWLSQAIQLAAACGHIRPFVDTGTALYHLLREMSHPTGAQAHLERILRAFETELLIAAKSTPHRTTGASDWAGNEQSSENTTTAIANYALIEPLTARELEVLQLLTEGLSNREIAQRLVIATGTVKRHTINLYGKLGVNSRTQAVAQARRLNIL